MQELSFEKLETILVEAGLLNTDKLQKFKELGLTDEKAIEKLLLSDEFIRYKEVLEVLANNMGVGFADLEITTVNSNAVKALDGFVARKYSVFPFDIKDNLLFLAMQNPDDIFLIDEIKVYAQMEIKPFLADFRLISRAIEYFYPTENEAVEDLHESGNVTDNSSENKKNDEDALQWSVDELVSLMAEKYLLPEYIDDVHLDTQNRTIEIRIKARY